ncbi:MAG: acetate--CoA ligase family protein [Dehalococcoidia bacterium]|nr:acetate--CoA ligase family protein [Dehalococcoidia bacterium]
MTPKATLTTLLDPESIAVIGASDDTSKPGGKLVRNIMLRGYAGQLMLVNPRSRQVHGIETYPSVAELPLAPDLAFIAIPARLVPGSLEELGKKGARAVVVLSAGFGETSQEGKKEEARLVNIADQYGVLLIGPNCSGIVSHAHASKFSGVPPVSRQGGIDFLSGSGATVDFLYELSTRRGLQFNSLLNVGNSAQTGVTDLLRLYDEAQDEDSSRVKLLYIEVMKQPVDFLRHARSLTVKGCSLAGIKSGSTEAGSRAAASHTGAMATNDTAVQALFDKAGIIRVQSRPELVDVATVLTCVGDRLNGHRIAVVSDAGGPAVVLADELNRLGFVVPSFRQQTRERIAQALPPGAATGNPVDCLPTRNGESIGNVLRIVAEEEQDSVDYILFIDGDSGLADNWEICQALMHAQHEGGIPVLPCFLSPVSAEDALAKYRDAGRCYFEDEVAMARALGRVVNRPLVTEPVTAVAQFDRDRIATLLAGTSGVLHPNLARQVLEAAGIRVPEQEEINCGVSPEMITISFPWAMKVVGPLHKSDVGGVRLGIRNMDEARQSCDALMRIPGATGCLIQQMVSGTEVIIGANREKDYGHLVAFGLGGIYTEALKDVQFRLAPLSQQEAEQMVTGLRAFPLIKGVRGQPGMNTQTLVDMLIRVSLLLTHFPAIREMDLNPIKGSGSDLYAVDARIIVD